MTTRDVLSFVFASVCFWSTQCELCQFCLNQLELNICCSAQCVLCRRQSAHQVLVVVVPSLVISSSCARDCVFITRDMLRTMVQEHLMCSPRPTSRGYFFHFFVGLPPPDPSSAGPPFPGPPKVRVFFLSSPSFCFFQFPRFFVELRLSLRDVIIVVGPGHLVNPRPLQAGTRCPENSKFVCCEDNFNDDM